MSGLLIRERSRIPEAAPKLMYSRTFNPLLMAISLAGCSQQSSNQQPVTADPDHAVSCRTGGETEMRPLCAAEQEGNIVTLRTPSGAFRRFRIVPDGRGLVAADGAAPAHVKILSPKQIEVTVENDHYLLPAKMASNIE